MKGGFPLFGHIGFSFTGLLFLVFLFIPNLLWLRRQPADARPPKENRALLLMERGGQAATTASLLLFRDYDPAGLQPRLIWYALAVVSMGLYLFCWARYFTGGQTMALFYGPLWFIPYPLAALPVFAGLMLGLYSRVGILFLSNILLGIGHIGIHMQHDQARRKTQRRRLR